MKFKQLLILSATTVLIGGVVTSKVIADQPILVAHNVNALTSLTSNPASSSSVVSIGNLALLPLNNIDEGGGGSDGGSGGGDGVPPPPPQSQYRLLTFLYTRDQHNVFPWESPNDKVVVAQAVFQKNDNGSWKETKANEIHIVCRVNGREKDHDDDRNASSTQLQFNQEINPGKIIDCDYRANKSGLQYKETKVLVP